MSEVRIRYGDRTGEYAKLTAGERFDRHSDPLVGFHRAVVDYLIFSAPEVVSDRFALEGQTFRDQAEFIVKLLTDKCEGLGV